MFSRVVLPNGVRSAVAARVKAKPDVETGGILVGRFLDDVLWIEKASGAGPKARHSRFRFSRDTEFAQRWLDRHHLRTDGQNDYVGEWHVHPSLDAPPSVVDRASLWKIAFSSRYETRTPVLMIVEHEPPAEMRFRIYRFAANPRRCDELSLSSDDPG